ncbi:hypothetical protein [Niabella sp.]|uniref:hypothetical protein n=1 Tax=Niabella sp. TaxID=1962976 RepID=UPI00261DAB2C|nr:hypothetical protein [Niabella sp.]
MKKKIATLLLLLTFLSKLLQAQIPVGLKYDINSTPLNGYFDPLTYNPKEKITAIYYSDSYEKGYYFDTDGRKITGLIRFKGDKIFFKSGKTESRDKIRPREIKQFVIGIDSFIAISNYYHNDRKKNEWEYAQYIASFDGYTFVKHYYFPSGVAQQYGGKPPVIETFLVKADNSDTWELLNDKGNVHKSLQKYFSQIPNMEKRFKAAQSSNDATLCLIKMAAYYHNQQTASPVYYDQYWQEVRDAGRATYRAEIRDRHDSIWTFEYYRDKTKLFSAHYSSFYPNIKEGDFILYYPDGKIRETILYKQDEPKETNLFDEHGRQTCHYLAGGKWENGKKRKREEASDDLIQFVSVTNAVGENVIKTGNEMVAHAVIDPFDGSAYNYLFQNGTLRNAYRLQGKDTIFQTVNRDFDFKIAPLQKKFDNYMLTKQYDEALSVNAQGTLLVSVLIDHKGAVRSGKILNSIHPEIDSLANGFIRKYLFSGYKLVTNVKNKKRTAFFIETVIPFEFGINRFYRKPVRYYNNNLNFLMMNQMMNRMMMNDFKVPAPPTFPGRF